MNKRVQSYRDLVIWQKGIELVKEVYKQTKKFPNHETFGLVSQMQRSAVSIPSKIAEGQTRQHTGEFRQFLYVALSSASELDTQTIIAHELDYITADEVKNIENQI